jgi:hypothetical protein
MDGVLRVSERGVSSRTCEVALLHARMLSSKTSTLERCIRHTFSDDFLCRLERMHNLCHAILLRVSAAKSLRIEIIFKARAKFGLQIAQNNFAKVQSAWNSHAEMKCISLRLPTAIET